MVMAHFNHLVRWFTFLRSGSVHSYVSLPEGNMWLITMNHHFELPFMTFHDHLMVLTVYSHPKRLTIQWENLTAFTAKFHLGLSRKAGWERFGARGLHICHEMESPLELRIEFPKQECFQVVMVLKNQDFHGIWNTWWVFNSPIYGDIIDTWWLVEGMQGCPKPL